MNLVNWAKSLSSSVEPTTSSPLYCKNLFIKMVCVGCKENYNYKDKTIEKTPIRLLLLIEGGRRSLDLKRAKDEVKRPEVPSTRSRAPVMTMKQ